MAQISILLIAWFGLVNWIKTKDWYRQRVVIPISICIGIIALYWLIGRMMG
jgi:hypothetical protein